MRNFIRYRKYVCLYFNFQLYSNNSSMIRYSVAIYYLFEMVYETIPGLLEIKVSSH